MKTILHFRHNVIRVDSILAFSGILGRVQKDCKDVCFARLLGVNSSFASDVARMDQGFTERMAKGERVAYRRILRLPVLSDLEDAAEYGDCCLAWELQGREYAVTKTVKEQGEYASLLGQALCTVLDYYDDGSASESMKKNFVVKLLFWHDFLLEDIAAKWDKDLSVKLVLSNVVKKQEYLFAYMLTLLGYDVLLLQSGADINKREDALGFSQKTVLGEFSNTELFAYDRKRQTERMVEEQQREDQKADRRPTVHLSHISRPPAAKRHGSSNGGGARVEKSFEELALLASSVVMIAIHDRNGGVIGTGSGIMVGRDGYILTNSHVASGGSFYSVRIEDDETVYSTHELIKYHSVLDLAVLRIDRALVPLPVYRGEKPLVRGQRVVAIGSPLGLFNSVSDGIISGFRKIDGVDMIQFTAPTSHGSSGGALLNLYGEVIGISTAGFDNAQNINLAVGFESIRGFLQKGILG